MEEMMYELCHSLYKKINIRIGDGVRRCQDDVISTVAIDCAGSWVPAVLSERQIGQSRCDLRVAREWIFSALIADKLDAPEESFPTDVADMSMTVKVASELPE